MMLRRKRSKNIYEFVSFDKLRTNGARIWANGVRIWENKKRYSNPVRPELVEGYELLFLQMINHCFARNPYFRLEQRYTFISIRGNNEKKLIVSHCEFFNFLHFWRVWIHGKENNFWY